MQFGEGEEEEEDTPAIPQRPVVTVVEGEADENEEAEDSDDDLAPSPKVYVPFIPQVTSTPKPESPPVDKPILDIGSKQEQPSTFYPGLKLPDKHTTNINPFATFSSIHSAPDTEKKSTSDFLNLFSNNNFSYANEEAAQDYVSSDLQRKVVRQNIQVRKALASKLVSVVQPAHKTVESIAPLVSESIVVIQDASHHIKHINEDLTGIVDIIKDMESFPYSILRTGDPPKAQFELK